MKRLFYCFVFVLLAGSVLAQPSKAPKAGKPFWTYAELVSRERLWRSPSVSFQEGKINTRFVDERLRDPKNGFFPRFESIVDAMNFLNRSGWQFVHAYGSSRWERATEHWVVRLLVREDENGNYVPVLPDANDKKTDN